MLHHLAGECDLPAFAPRQIVMDDGHRSRWRAWQQFQCSGGYWCWPRPGGAPRVPDGTWLVSQRIAFDVFPCQNALCGRIVWLRDPALRTASMCGRTLIWDLTSDGPAQWDGGCFFDPENGATYNVSARVETADRIAARIYRGFAHVRQYRDPDPHRVAQPARLVRNRLRPNELAAGSARPRLIDHQPVPLIEVRRRSRTSRMSSKPRARCITVRLSHITRSFTRHSCA